MYNKAGWAVGRAAGGVTHCGRCSGQSSFRTFKYAQVQPIGKVLTFIFKTNNMWQSPKFTFSYGENQSQYCSAPHAQAPTLPPPYFLLHFKTPRRGVPGAFYGRPGGGRDGGGDLVAGKMAGAPVLKSRAGIMIWKSINPLVPGRGESAAVAWPSWVNLIWAATGTQGHKRSSAGGNKIPS